MPSVISVVSGVINFEPAGALSLPIKGKLVSVLTPPISTKGAVHTVGNTKPPPEFVITLVSPVSAEPLLLLSQSTVESFK